jgi:hypothetical protein
MKKIKLTKIILKKKQKNHIKNHAGKHCSIPQYFFKKNYKAKFSTSSILKNKIDKNNSEKKTQKKKKNEKRRR